MKVARILFFLVGSIFIVASLPISSGIMLELYTIKNISDKYTITSINGGDDFTDSTIYSFRGNIIEIEEELKESVIYKDLFDNYIGIADVTLKINGKEIETLKDHPIRTGYYSGLSRYFGEVAFLLLGDKKNNDTQFVVLLKKTKEFLKAKPNGDLEGWVPIEELDYTMITLDSEGNIGNTSFNLTERDALQTHLLNEGNVVPHTIGYHNQYMSGYLSLLFPIAFPFGTLLIGIILLLVGFLIKRKKKLVS
ncbi:hypothetical protein [Bacillus alkalicellulosilyticus]|uniref:hypothetical protein n=1 Tax=Alkalihalobacterium alkalicellulosilyticum TaxID=1912214 RepID=UPI0009965E31|nr:hypothetical protein [Bacillus alkalicellulosilyticus]